MENIYLEAVEKRLGKSRMKKQITAELESHMLDKIDYYTELGYSQEEAEKRAVKEMGAPDDAALPLRELHDRQIVNFVSLVISVLFLTATAIIPLFFHKFDYASDYYQAVYHSIGIDFLSLAIVSGYLAVLIFALRHKIKTVTLLAAVSLLIVGFEGCAVFRPAVYAAAKLFDSGFGGYIGSVFAYSYFPKDLRLLHLSGSWFIWGILLLWAVIQWFAVLRQERMKSSRFLFKILRVGKTVMAVLLCVDLLIMTAGTVVAAIQLPQKRELVFRERKEMIDYLLNTPVESINGQVLTEKGFSAYGFGNRGADSDDNHEPTLNDLSNLTESYYLLSSNNCLMCAEESNIGYFAAYSRTDFDTAFDMLGDYQVDKALLYDRQYDNLQEFLDEGWYDKAIMIGHQYNPVAFDAVGTPTTGIETIFFVFFTENGKTSDIFFQADKLPNSGVPDFSHYICRGTTDIITEE